MANRPQDPGAPVRCLYCGGEVPAEHEQCPQCGAPSHFRRRRGFGSPRRFIIFFILVALFSFVVAFLAPR